MKRFQVSTTGALAEAHVGALRLTCCSSPPSGRAIVSYGLRKTSCTCQERLQLAMQWCQVVTPALRRPLAVGGF